jgi:retinol dehydrogenase-12
MSDYQAARSQSPTSVPFSLRAVTLPGYDQAATGSSAVGSAPALGAGGRGFKSPLPDRQKTDQPTRPRTPKDIARSSPDPLVPETSLAGRTYLVTGANSGIGRAAAEALASRGATVVAACRSQERAQPVVEAIRRSTGNEAVFFLKLDLASLASVRDAARNFEAFGLPLHVLVNNAGTAGVRGTTSDGFEVTFGTNHLGHFLLTSLLLPRLRASAPSRVVTVASASHFQAKGMDFERFRRGTRSLTTYPEYCVSKLCNVLFAQELGRRETANGVSSFSLHPGVVRTRIWRRVPWPARAILTRSMLSPEDGALTVLFCATAPGIEALSGGYFDNCALRAPSHLVQPALARELWEKSSEWVAPFIGDTF